MVKNTPNIGLVGCGRWGQYILRDLVSLGARVEVVARSNESITRAQKFGASNIVSSLEELNADLDGYIVSTPTVTHYDVVKALVPRGKPLFVEKPLSNSSDHVSELLASGAEIFIMHKWRYHPGIVKIKQMVESNKLGRVLSINATRNQWGSPHKDVNTVWIHIPHDLSMIFHLLGRIPPLKSSHLTYDKNDQIMGVNAVFQDEVSCTVEHNACVVEKSRSFSVHFENGGIELNDPLSDHLMLRHGQPNERNEVVKIPISQKFPLLIEIEAFLNYLKSPSNKLHGNLSDELQIVTCIEKVLKKGKMA